jgi:D-lactate dehydrogenase (cytochrome)
LRAGRRKPFGNRFSVNASVREQHGHTLTWLPVQPPDAVVFAQSTEEVASIVKLCAQHRVPVIPFGTGTSLEGHVNAPYGGICIDTSLMSASSPFMRKISIASSSPASPARS